MSEANGYTWRKWQMRAETIQRNAESLFADMMDQLGVEDIATDHADNIVSYTEDMIEHIKRRKPRKAKQ